jgi:hypothetical protein
MVTCNWHLSDGFYPTSVGVHVATFATSFFTLWDMWIAYPNETNVKPTEMDFI